MSRKEDLEKLIKQKEQEIKAEETRLDFVDKVNTLNDFFFVKWLNEKGIKLKFTLGLDNSSVGLITDYTQDDISKIGYGQWDNPFDIFSVVSLMYVSGGVLFKDALGDLLCLENVRMPKSSNSWTKLRLEGNIGTNVEVVVKFYEDDICVEVTERFLLPENLFSRGIFMKDSCVDKNEITYYLKNYDSLDKIRDKFAKIKERVDDSRYV